tara:strand:- start:911 stop:1627 length:717 start_codon:yes stop_codon:yes gene_type:complete
MSDIPTSGAISLNQMHTEVGGSSGSTVSINDADIRGLIGKASGATMSFNEWYGASAASLSTWAFSGISTAPDPWGFASYTSATYAQAGCNYAQKVDTANDRLEHRFSTFNSGAASIFSYAYQSYTGLDSATFEGKAVYSVSSSGTVGSVDNPASYSPATNTWTTVSTSTYSPVWQWVATVNSGSGTRSLSGSVTFYVRASLSGTYYPNSTGYNSGSKSISLSATRGTAGPGGPGGGGL